MLILFFIGCFIAFQLFVPGILQVIIGFLCLILKKTDIQKTETGRIDRVTLKIVLFFYLIFQLKTLLIGFFRDYIKVL